jgi:hypothetical protein
MVGQPGRLLYDWLCIQLPDPSGFSSSNTIRGKRCYRCLRRYVICNEKPEGSGSLEVLQQER